MDNEIKFALKVWATGVIGGAILASIFISICNLSPEGFLFGLYILFFAATRGIPSLILFYIATALINKTKWHFKFKIRVLAIIGAVICLINIILFLYRKKLEDLQYLIPDELFTLLGFAGSVVAGVFFFKKQLITQNIPDTAVVINDLEQQP